MFARLKGIIDSIDLDRLVLDVNGVGYLVLCSGRTLRQAGREGEALALHIETHVREDAIILYGFADVDERDWFRLLTTVQGVGPKVGLALLTALPPDQLGQVIAAQDAKTLTQADGVGPKLANRIISELKDKVAGLVFAAPATGKGKAGSAAAPPSAGAAGEAVSALVNLGYKRTEAFVAVSAAMGRLGSDAAVQTLIREGLKELGKV
ncbi:MAG: Holliday junction branch migration protein RuvA [Pseudomonadota bacterium]|nr:Holliday junction branch migration protein RuvA [Pseudomonadota bacterium]